MILKQRVLIFSHFLSRFIDKNLIKLAHKNKSDNFAELIEKYNPKLRTIFDILYIIVSIIQMISGMILLNLDISRLMNRLNFYNLHIGHSLSLFGLLLSTIFLSVLGMKQKLTGLLFTNSLSFLGIIFINIFLISRLIRPREQLIDNINILFFNSNSILKTLMYTFSISLITNNVIQIYNEIPNQDEKIFKKDVLSFMEKDLT